MAVTEYQIPQQPGGDERKEWYQRPLTWVAIGATGIAGAFGVGVATSGGEKAPEQPEPAAEAPAVPGEEAPAEQPDSDEGQVADEASAAEEAPATSLEGLDVESFFSEPKIYPSGAFAAMSEQEQSAAINESLVNQATDYLEAAVAVIEAGGDPSVDISEDLLAYVAESRNVDAVTALNDLAAQIVANKPTDTEVTWVRVGEGEVAGDNVSSLTRDPEGIIQTYLSAGVDYTPAGADASQTQTAYYISEFDYAVPAQDYKGQIVFANQ